MCSRGGVNRFWIGSTAISLVLVGFALNSSAAADPVRLLIVAGQSNAVGRNADGASLSPPLDSQPDVLFRYEIGNDDSINQPQERISSDGWIALTPQADEGSGTFTHLTGFGPEVQLGRALADTSTDQIAILKFAINGSSLSSDWAASTGPLYFDLIANVLQALSDLQGLEHEHTPEVAGFFWMQGEWDALDSIQAAAYEANLTSFIAAVRADLSELNLPFILGRVCSGLALTGDFPGLFVVRDAQNAVARADPLTRRVGTDFIPLDTGNVHFNASGQIELGLAFAETLAQLAGNGEFLLLDPSPGIAGNFNDFKVFGADPERKIYFVFGLRSGSVSVPDCPGLSLDIGSPVAPGRVDVDALGVASVNLHVPAGISGQTVLIQALERSNCRVSNLVQFTFP